VDRLDQAGQGGLVGFVADVPFGCPEQLRMGEHPGTAGHPGESEIGGIGQQRRHQRHAVFGQGSGAQM